MNAWTCSNCRRYNTRYACEACGQSRFDTHDAERACVVVDQTQFIRSLEARLAAKEREVERMRAQVAELIVKLDAK